MTEPSDPITFLLIPGAGADRIAPPLPLDDPDAMPSDHATAIVAALGDPPPAPLVVVGQSLGAYSAAVAAERLRPRRLILLAPMIPAPGESAGE